MNPSVAALPEWLELDEREDVISTLEHAVEIAGTLQTTPLNWKWMIIAIHNALQGALVCTLSGSDGMGALGEKSMAEIWGWYHDSSDGSRSRHPKEWLAPPLELYKRAKRTDFMREFGGAPIITTEDEDDDVQTLNILRRNFEHFTPRSWCIETAGLPRIVMSAIRVIGRLLQHPAFVLRLEQEQVDRAHRAVNGLRHEYL